MTTEFPFFVDRQEELGVIRHAVIDERGKRQVVLLHGPGGIGKTRLLQKVREEYASMPWFTISEVLDLYEPELRVPVLWERRVARQIGDDSSFTNFETEYRGLLELESRGISAETLARARDRVDEAFVQGFNRMAAKERIVLLLDTLEEVQRVGGLWPHLLDLMARLDNVAWIIAGRHCDEVRAEIEARIGSQNVHWLLLQGFDRETADEYFDEYFRRPSVLSLDTEMREKIRLLTEGSPILIALAITWLENEMPLPEIEIRSVDELQTMADEALNELKKEVKQALVKRLLAFANTVDKIVLNMAWVERRFNAEILNYLMGIPESDVLDKVASLPFVKIRPGEDYVLHDEMRDMVVEYVWPSVDPDGTLRRKIDLMMVDYYAQKVKDLKVRANELKRKREEVRQAEDVQAELQVFEKLSEVDRQRDVLEVERLFYTLRADLEQGIARFIRGFDWATGNYRLGFRDMYWEEIQRFEERFGGTRRFEVDIRGAKHLLDVGNSAAAQKRGTEILERFARTGEEIVETLVHLGNCALRLGHPIEARDFYSQARDICDEQGMQSWLAVVENGLGLAYRSSGDWDGAAKHYRESVSACEEFNSPPQHLASALNNYAYVLGLKGRYEEAIALCEQALSLREDIRHWRGVGSGYSTLGELYRYQQRYERAFEYYDRALHIFEEHDDREWLSIVYQEWAIAKAYAGKLDEAWKSVQRALELCERYNIRALPWALNRAGRITLVRSEYDQSERFLRRGITEAKKAGDVWFLLATTVELMESRYARFQKKRDIDIQELWKEFEELAGRVEEYEREQYGFRDLFGRTHRILGHVQFNLGNYGRALEYYKKAYPLIASGYYGSHGLHKLPDELEELGKRVDALAPDEAIRWCDELREAWGRGTGALFGLTGFCATHRHKAQQRKKAEGAK
jgi:tetratricopeptide (TPR) repeat protein/AAA+ ATPase superfamily predicted ATPase